MTECPETRGHAALTALMISGLTIVITFPPSFFPSFSHLLDAWKVSSLVALWISMALFTTMALISVREMTRTLIHSKVSKVLRDPFFWSYLCFFIFATVRICVTFIDPYRLNMYMLLLHSGATAFLAIGAFQPLFFLMKMQTATKLGAFSYAKRVRTVTQWYFCFLCVPMVICGVFMWVDTIIYFLFLATQGLICLSYIILATFYGIKAIRIMAEVLESTKEERLLGYLRKTTRFVMITDCLFISIIFILIPSFLFNTNRWGYLLCDGIGRVLEFGVAVLPCIQMSRKVSGVKSKRSRTGGSKSKTSTIVTVSKRSY